MSRVIYGVIGIFVIAVIILTGLVGYLYGQEPQTVTVTIPTTTTVTTTQPIQTTTKTTTVTTTTQTQSSQYKIEATTETVNGSLIGFIRLSAPPGDLAGLLVEDLNGERLNTIIMMSNREFLDRVVVWRQQFNPENVKEDYYTFILKAQNGSVVYRTTIKLLWEVIPPFELLYITSAYANSRIEVIINLGNGGSLDVMITDILVNGKPLRQFDAGATISPDMTNGFSLIRGISVSIKITFSQPLSSGVTYDFKIHTASGTDYPKAVVIP